MLDRRVLKAVFPLVLMLLFGLGLMWLGGGREAPVEPSPAPLPASTRPPAPPPQASEEDLQIELQLLYNKMNEAHAAGDLDSVFASVAPSYTFQDAAGQVYTRQELWELLSQLQASGMQVSTVTSVEFVEVQPDGSILAETREIQHQRMPDGRSNAVEMHSEETWVRASDGSLLLQHAEVLDESETGW